MNNIINGENVYDVLTLSEHHTGIPGAVIWIGMDCRNDTDRFACFISKPLTFPFHFDYNDYVEVDVANFGFVGNKQWFTKQMSDDVRAWIEKNHFVLKKCIEDISVVSSFDLLDKLSKI